LTTPHSPFPIPGSTGSTAFIGGGNMARSLVGGLLARRLALQCVQAGVGRRVRVQLEYRPNSALPESVGVWADGLPVTLPPAVRPVPTRDAARSMIAELAGAGFPILTLVDLTDIWVVFNIREDDFAGIRIGAPLDGAVPALGIGKVLFVIDTISPRGDYATWRATRQSSGYDVRTFEVRARPQSPVEGLRPGMSVLVAPR